MKPQDLILAILMFLVGCIFAYSYEAHRLKRMQAGWELTPVMVATQQLSVGTTLTSGSYATGEIPGHWLNDQYFRPQQAQQMEGHPLLMAVEPNQILSKALFSSAWTLKQCQATCKAKQAAHQP
jgi:Flp pilus assembly protein CpaB